MDLVWLEDLVELAATRNFSVAAKSRGVTQPAFSRRIKALENWVGTELIDRSGYPVSLTAAGESVLEAGRAMIQDVYRVRDECRQLTLPGGDTISISALHSIAVNICPNYFADLDDRRGPFRTRIEALDYYDTLDALSDGRSDLALSYSHEWGPPILKVGHFRRATVGHDPFVLAASPDAIQAMDQHFERGVGTLKMPLVAYSANCFLGKMQHVLIENVERTGVEFQTVFECSMSEVIKNMILAGRGVGWLPLSGIREEIAAERLAFRKVESSRVDLDVVLLRRQSPGNATVERFWDAASEAAL